MTNFIWLTDASGPAAEDRIIPDALRMAGSVVAVTSFADLKKELSACSGKPAVVIVSVPLPKLGPLLADMRTVSSAVACVALVDASENPQPFELECQLLRRPYTAFDLQCKAASAIRQAELMAALSSAGQLDEATGLFNQPYFIKRLGAEISLAKRHLSPLACVVVGIKYYQVLLDSYGYDFINQLMTHIGEMTRKQLREEDIAARIGDQEVALLLPRSTEKGARVLANRLLLAVNGTPFDYDGTKEDVTIYAGIAGYPVDGHEKMDADTLVRFAHHALHSARFGDEDEESGSAKTVSIRLFSEIQPAI